MAGKVENHFFDPHIYLEAKPDSLMCVFNSVQYT